MVDNRRWFSGEEWDKYANIYRLLSMLRKLNVAVEYAMFKESLAGKDRYVFDYKLLAHLDQRQSRRT
jgi:hypothetical protein